RRYRANIVFMNVKVVLGGAERFDSVANSLAQLAPEADFVAVHDAVRPCLASQQIDQVFGAAAQYGDAILANQIHDTINRTKGPCRKIAATLPRETLWLPQTRQAFRRDWLTAAYASRAKVAQPITDDAQLVEALGHPSQIVSAPASNIKITT